MTKSRDVRSIQTKLIKASECMSEVFTRYEELSKENKQLKENIHSMLFTDDVVQDRYDTAIQENKKLKELLKECESSIQYYQETYGAMDLDTYTLLAKLNEVLNE